MLLAALFSLPRLVGALAVGVFLNPRFPQTLFSLLRANYGRTPDAGRFPVLGRKQALGLIRWAAHCAWRDKSFQPAGSRGPHYFRISWCGNALEKRDGRTVFRNPEGILEEDGAI